VALSLRDRFFTPQVARAITSPSAIVATGAGAAIGLVAVGGGGGIVAAVVGAVVLFAGRVGLAIPRGGREHIDPFRLGEPWRRLVQDAQSAKAQFAGAVRRARSGPLRDRLAGIDQQLDDGVSECWRVAQAGHALSDARKRVDVAAAQRELDEVQRAGYANETTAGTVAAIEAQIASARRMDTTIAETRDRLRLLNARLDEAVTRAIELSVSTASDAQLASVGDDVSSITLEMEALRQGLEATDAAAGEARPSGGAG
jgi:hypothetical protein